MKEETKRIIRVISWILFTGYVLLLVYLLFLAEFYGRRPGVERELRYNLVPFQEINRFLQHRDIVGRWSAFLNLGGNILGFVPFGFFLPVLGRWWRKAGRIIPAGFCISLLVETVQLFTRVGSFDVDDLLLNTLGCALGFGLFAACDRMRRWYYYEKKI